MNSPAWLYSAMGSNDFRHAAPPAIGRQELVLRFFRFFF